MVYLLGTTNREYVIEGVTLPKKSYNEREIELGKKTAVGIDEVVYAKLGANKIFQGLVKQGTIIVRDKEPEGIETMAELRVKRSSEKEAAAKEIAALKDEIASLKANSDISAIKQEALKEIADRDKTIAELKEELVKVKEQLVEATGS